MLPVAASASPEDPVFPLSGIEDQGKFTYYSHEERVGLSSSRLTASGAFTNESVTFLARQRIPQTLDIATDEEGRWTAMTFTRGDLEVKIIREGTRAKITALGDERWVELKPGSLVLEDMSPALLAQCALRYDHERGGAQEVGIFFVPARAFDGSIEFLDAFDRLVAGAEHRFRRYRYVIKGIYSVTVTVDEANRVCLAEYPEQHGVFVREGYDALRVAGSDVQGLLSKPEHEVRLDAGVAVPMRDGTNLATDIYRPDAEGRFPAILVRTPYKKELGELKARFYARRGYVFAVQDVRGRFASEGTFEPFLQEGEDGHDAVEWLADRTFCDGKVGMIGASYLGWAQWLAARHRPPHLVTMIPNVAPPEPFFNIPYENGALFLSGALWWADVVDRNVTADLTGVAMGETGKVFTDERIRELPVIDLDLKVLGRKNPHWRAWIAHPRFDGWWDRARFEASVEDLDIPVYHQSGWFDGDGIGSKRNYLAVKKGGKSFQKLVLGPWGHTDRATRFGAHGIDFGPDAVIDLETSYLRWMDRWLKGMDNGIDAEPRVSLFLMGSNRWVHGDTYPLVNTRMTPVYLASSGNAAGGAGTGRLIFTPPGGSDHVPDRYDYDPGDPTPDNPEGRKDLAVYRSPPFKKPLDVAGPLRAVLYAKTSARDTDWVVRVAREDARGRPLVLGIGVIRARFRESWSEPELLTPGTIHEYVIDLWQTGVTFRKGDRLVVVVSSSLFPRFSRNLNTGGHNETETEYVTARQTIYHDAMRPSRIELSVIGK